MVPLSIIKGCDPFPSFLGSQAKCGDGNGGEGRGGMTS